MSVPTPIPSAPPAEAARAAVTRIVDCEPPAVVAASIRPGPIAGRRRPARDRRVRPVHRPGGEPSARTRHAAAFADAALRLVLEVIDLRRPPGQLRSTLAAGLADSVEAFRRTTRVTQAAVLRRVRLQAADTGETAFEVAATYSRGPRVHAIACRVEQTIGTHGDPRWQVVALHIG